MLRRMMALAGALIVTAFGLAAPLAAQTQEGVVWIQVEARPSLAEATDRAKAYSTLLEDVNGFGLSGGWYAVALGPYTRADAAQVLQIYRRDGLVPDDSFIQFTSAFGQQFWPVGANVLGRGVIEPPVAVPGQPDQPAVQTPPVTGLAPGPVDEAPAEARLTERTLSEDARKQLQMALQWAGFYNAAIDGAFGRGTRGSMAAWQEANGHDATGILTTLQRESLIAQYNAVLEGLGMELVRDSRAGIEVALPTDIVAFDRYEPPFAHYGTAGEVAAQVLLISQPGDQATLFGLYEIMQTLEIVPLDGPRSRNTAGFEITGRNARLVSYTQATLENGEIKGFTLIWPAGDEERRARVVEEMMASFARLPGVLSPTAGAASDQAIDLVAGLQVRQPKVSRSGFFVTREGVVATTSEVVQGCGRLTLDSEIEAALVLDDKTRGVAFVRPVVAVAPRDVAALAAVEPRLQSDLAVAGYSYEGVLSAPSVSYGTLADVKGLHGETELSRLTLQSLPGDAGGPVMDMTGTVVGMLLPGPGGDRQLPDDVSLALNAASLAEAAADAGIATTSAEPADILSNVRIAERAGAMTVLVSCWE